MQELIKQFAAGNHKTVAIINLVPLNTNPDGTTPQELTTFGATTVHSNKDIPVNEGDLLAKNPNLHEDTKQLIRNIYKKGESPIVIQLSQEEINRAKTDPYSLLNITLTIVHELVAHAIKDKDGVQRDAGPQHEAFFNDPQWDGDYSPEYSVVKTDSDAGRYQRRIEKAAKDLGLDKPQPNNDNKKKPDEKKQQTSN